MYKSKFTFSDGEEQFEGYTNGGFWNGWAYVVFTRNQVKALFDTTPYEYYFIDGDLMENIYPILVVKWDDCEEYFDSCPICVEYDDGTNEVDIFEGFHLHGLEFMEVK